MLCIYMCIIAVAKLNANGVMCITVMLSKVQWKPFWLANQPSIHIRGSEKKKLSFFHYLGYPVL